MEHFGKLETNFCKVEDLSKKSSTFVHSGTIPAEASNSFTLMEHFDKLETNYCKVERI